MSVFLDTSYLYACITVRDQWHRLALAAPWPVPGGVTSSLIVNETVTLLQTRGFFSRSLEFLQSIRDDNKIEIVYADTELQQKGWNLLWSNGGSGANAVDCTSFALMKQRRIRLAYTFDKHFHQAGFQTLLPDSSL